VSLLAGLDLHDGRITEIVSDTHNSADFITFLRKLDGAYAPHQKSGLVYALDPGRKGEILWQTRVGPGVAAKHPFLRGGNGRLCLGKHSFTGLEGDSAGNRTRAHGKENPPVFCAEPCLHPTRVLSPRQLPTDHDYAVPTRGY
jgi:hypothetical protein